MFVDDSDGSFEHFCPDFSVTVAERLSDKELEQVLDLLTGQQWRHLSKRKCNTAAGSEAVRR